MKSLRFLIVALAATLVGAAIASCSTKMVTPQQKQASNRGAKLDKEECEALAMAATKTWRAYGNGVSAKEAFANSIAELDAKTRLSRQLEEQINGLIRTFNQQHEAGAGSGSATSLTGKSTEIQEGYVDKLLSNVRTICNNTYVKENGDFNVYVCVEMSEEGVTAIHKKLTDDKKLSIDFAEDQFKKDMAKAKEDYRSNQ
jgi:outer membrane protein assembly factor BamE (lipoprotein component of BamABCDE complex)